MKNLFFCLRCSEISISDERLVCSNCENDESRTAVAENLKLPLPEPENVSPGCHVPAKDAGIRKSEEDFVLAEPIQEASAQMLEENPNETLQLDRCQGYENCSKIDGPSQNIMSHDFHQYAIGNQNRLGANSNTNEDEFIDLSSDICNDATSIVILHDTPAASQQTHLSEESSVGECENKNDSDELLRRQGTKEPTKHRVKSDSFVFTDSITSESEYPVMNLLSESSEKVEDRRNKDKIPPTFSSCPRRNPSVNKCFQENLLKANKVSQQKPQRSKRRCEKCGRYFMTEWTFYAHKEIYCSNPRKPYKCGECGKIFSEITKLILHQRIHTGEKPFKCKQCDYASARPDYLKNHMKTHTKK